MTRFVQQFMSNSKLNIAFVRRGYSPSGGAEAYLKRTARALVERGHKVQLIATNEWPTSEWSFGQLTRLRVRSSIAFADELEELRLQIQGNVLMSFERVWRCDIYRAGDGVHAAWLQRRRKFQMPLQRFIHPLNPKHREILRLEESLLARGGTARVIANSEMVKNEIIDFYNYSADRIDIVRNGIRLEEFGSIARLREKARQDLELEPSETALLFAGTGWERKGLIFAIQAMALGRDRKLRLFVVGRGNPRPYKAKRVRFLGELADLKPIYAAADIFILPTIYDPFSNACLEALASGLPVITTRANGFSEIIEHEVHGSVVDSPHELTQLRDAIQFWSDESRRAAAKSAMLERASQFDIAKSVDQTLAILAGTDGHAPSCP
jgi:UDP-glucose:(heptosyl)LPS alpha-1,3-glucosyltransferase